MATVRFPGEVIRLPGKRITSPGCPGAQEIRPVPPRDRSNV